MSIDQSIANLVAGSAWTVFFTAPSTPLSEVAAQLGRIMPSRHGGPLTDRLIPKEPSAGSDNTLSARFGRGEFPFHTDGATKPVPPRFIVLRAAVTDPCRQPTAIAMPHWPPEGSHDHSLLADAMLLVRTGVSGFLSSIVSRATRERTWFARHNPCCIQPLDAQGRQAQELLLDLIDSSTRVEVEWKAGTTVVIDNWRAVHSRGPAADPHAKGRILERCWVHPEW